MLSSININTIISEPLLLVSAILLALSPVMFVVALYKFVTTPKTVDVPSFDVEESAPEPTVEPAPAAEETLSERTVEAPPPPEPAPIPPPRAAAPRAAEDPSERTVLLPAGISEIQGQLEIAFSQIKMLNKKVHALESEVESVSRQAVGRLEPNELKEPPMNAADFTQKLLKLAEHVIILEKEMSRIRSGKMPEAQLAAEPAATPSAAAPAAPSKPPIMPV